MSARHQPSPLPSAGPHGGLGARRNTYARRGHFRTAASCQKPTIGLGPCGWPIKCCEWSTRVLAPPFAHGTDDRAEVATLCGEDVLGPRGAHRIEAPLDDAILLKRPQAFRQRIRGNAFQRVLQLLKAPWTVQKKVPQDKAGPTRTDDADCAGHRALGCVLIRHVGTLCSHCVIRNCSYSHCHVIISLRKHLLTSILLVTIRTIVNNGVML